MAKAGTKPFLMTVEKAVDHLEKCMRKRPAVYVAPKILIPMLKVYKRTARLASRARARRRNAVGYLHFE